MNISRLFKKLYRLSKAIYITCLFPGFVILLLFAPVFIVAQGNLLIVPRRVVFDGSKRTLDLNLANIGKDSATYLISLVQIRMREDGTFENITEPDSGQYFATKYLRIFPRSVTLAPKEAQLVKVQLVQASNLSPGEYRSHIYFRSVPAVIPAGEKEVLVDSAALTVRLIPVFGISIPAIIRIGQNSSMVNISDVCIDLTNIGKPQVNMYLNRTGNMSVYGDLIIEYISAQGKKINIGIVNGVAVYTPLSRRKIKMDIKSLPDVDYHTGKLHVLYSLPAVAKVAVVLAERDLVLQ